MTVDSLNHYTLRTRDVERARRFYEDVIGLRTGDRPPFSFPGLWLYTGDGVPALHLVGVGDGDDAALEAYLGGGQGEAGTGPIDHIAFSCRDVEAVRRRLDGAGIAFTERTVPLLGLRQLFVRDPEGVTLELNFPETMTA